MESFKNRLTMEDRLERIESFDYLPFLGPVRMSDPDVVFSNFEFWGLDANRRPTAPYRLVNGTIRTGNTADFFLLFLRRTSVFGFLLPQVLVDNNLFTEFSLAVASERVRGT